MTTASLLMSAILAALLWQTPAESGAKTVSIRGNDIWLQTASGERQLTHDRVRKRLPTFSPSGDALIYVVDHLVPNEPPKEEIIVLDMEGNVRKRITPEGYVPAAFDRLDWLDDHRIGAMTCGHANCMYWVMNPQSGKTVQVMFGGFDFIWSHDRQFVVRLLVADGSGWAEDYSQAEHDAVLFNQDDVIVYPPERSGKLSDHSQSHNIGIGTGPRFVWSPDDKWVAFTDLTGSEGDWYVVILGPDGKMLRDTVPLDPANDASLQWLDRTHLDLHAGDRVFHFAINEGAFNEVRAADQGRQ